MRLAASAFPRAPVAEGGEGCASVELWEHELDTVSAVGRGTERSAAEAADRSPRRLRPGRVAHSHWVGKADVRVEDEVLTRSRGDN